jgi:MoxR-like ATPase
MPRPEEQLDDSAAADVQMLKDKYETVCKNLAEVVVGQREVLKQLLMAILCGRHAILVGVPGLAKTLMVKTLAQNLQLEFSRIQFTPDLMPSDITGTEVMQAGSERRFEFLGGPIFANIVLADEINRTPPKTQAALLEAMQEHKVTIGKKTHPLDRPFFVLATQNPIEQAGTYPLPEAQLDRFMFLITLDYPGDDDEVEIIRRNTSYAPQAVTSSAREALDRLLPTDEIARFSINMFLDKTLRDPATNDSGGITDEMKKRIEVLVQLVRDQELHEPVAKAIGQAIGERRERRNLSKDEILLFQQLVRKIPVADSVLKKTQRLVALTRPKGPHDRGFHDEIPSYKNLVTDYVEVGAGPRAGIDLILAAKASAALQGKYFVSFREVEDVALPVLRHRIKRNFRADSEGKTADAIVEALLTDLRKVQ